MPTVLHLRLTVLPGRREELVAFLRDAVRFYEAPGGIRIRLLQDATDPDRFIEVVEYRDTPTYLRDQERVEGDPEMRAYLERWRKLLRFPVQVETYHDVTHQLDREDP